MLNADRIRQLLEALNSELTPTFGRSGRSLSRWRPGDVPSLLCRETSNDGQQVSLPDEIVRRIGDKSSTWLGRIAEDEESSGS